MLALTTPGGPATDPAPIAADGGSGPIRLGSLTFAWGPYRVQRTRRPNVYRQQGINAWLLNDYGMFPQAFTLVGYATSDTPPYWPDPAVIGRIYAQFPGGTATAKLLCPYQGIATMVRLVQIVDQTDTTVGPGEVAFTADLEEADGVYTTRE